MFSLQLLGIGVVALSLIGAGVYLKGRMDGGRLARAETAALSVAHGEAARHREASLASSLAAERKRNAKVRVRVETLVREVPIYRDAVCRHSPDGLRDINAVILGTLPAEPNNDSGVPRLDPAQ